MSTRMRATALLLLPLAATLILAACGGGSSSKSAAVPPTTTTAAPAGGAGANRAALQAFTQCMSDQGAPVPTFPRTPRTTVAGQAPPTTDANGGGFGRGGGFGGGLAFANLANSSDPKIQAAYNVCKAKLPAGFLQQQQQRANALNAFISCMKDHGVTVAGGGFGRGPGATGSTTTTTPAYAAALAICRPLLPQRPTTTTTAAQ